MNLEDFCAYFKPIIESQSRVFFSVFQRICEVEEVSFKKVLSKDKEKFRSIKKQYQLHTPDDDFVFRKTYIVNLKKGVNLTEFNLESVKSSSMLVILLFKDILFKLNKKIFLCKTLSGYSFYFVLTNSEITGQSNRIEVNHFVYDEYKICEILFFQILPRYPCFYTLLTKKQTPLFIHFFERTLRHTFLFSKFLDPILVDTFYMVNSNDFKISRPLEIPENLEDELLISYAEKSKQRFAQMITFIMNMYKHFPMNLVLRTEIIRSYIKFFLEAMSSLLKALEQLKQIKEENLSDPKNDPGSFELEQQVCDSLKVLRNVSLSLFMTSKLINWYRFLEQFDIIDLFVNFYEYLTIKLNASNLFKKEQVLKFLNIPVFVRRNEVSVFCI
jgi:hypothetical protein